jgi:hypothetical protein
MYCAQLVRRDGLGPPSTMFCLRKDGNNPDAALSLIDYWLYDMPMNETPLDFLNGDASGTFYSKLPSALTSGELEPFLDQLHSEQSS